jgi:flagellar motility protein MotE (MotC chaperone)
MDVLRGIELERAKDLAKRFELQKDDAWPGLRGKAPREIARYLALMDPKRAARLLTLAGQDREYPDLVQAIHRSWLNLDLDGLSGDQVGRLATLYAFMAAEDVADALRAESGEDAAAVIRAIGDPKKEAAILLAIRAEDPAREAEIQTHLERPTTDVR